MLTLTVFESLAFPLALTHRCVTRIVLALFFSLSLTHTHTHTSHTHTHKQHLGNKFNDENFLAIMPWDDTHIPKGTPFLKVKTRTVDQLKKAWGKIMAAYESAWDRYNRSGQHGDECFCLCGAKGFWTTTGWKSDFKERLEPFPGNPQWHPRPSKSVWLWKLASDNVATFNEKSTKLLGEGIRQRGRLMGAGSEGLQQGT